MALRDPNTIDLNAIAGSRDLVPYELRFYASAEDTVQTTSQFLADLVTPDGQAEARLEVIRLIKGTAVQHNPPRNNLRKIAILGVFMTKDDFDKFMQWYLSNPFSMDDPFPTDYLKLKRDFGELVDPDGRVYLVSAAGKPTSAPKRASQGRVIHEFNADLYWIDTDEVF